MREKVLVLGGGFGGLTAALRVKRALGQDADVTVVSAADRFLYTPSLARLPFGRRRPEELGFPLAPTLWMREVRFAQATVTAIDPAARLVRTTAGEHPYDHLVVATGCRDDLAALPGLAEADGAWSVTTLEGALRAGEGWRAFLDDPGPVVVGAAQGACCPGLARAFLAALTAELRRAGLRERTPIAYVTAGGERRLAAALERQGVQAVTGAVMTEAAPGKLRLADGTTLAYAYAMIVPPSAGQDVVRAVPGLTDARGFVPVLDTCRSRAHPGLYAVGTATGPGAGPHATAQARVAAVNIAAAIRGEPPAAYRPGLAVPAPPRSRAAGALFEKYYLWKARHGYVRLP
ncbi:FAD-dependent oxidoreductase [Actinomadura sp. ATCC 31491]|uniref:FAD-dependent oxidoreductase n=1 Tax=Actinomadura luzonensis TaxID=2805427 RepID=A0ABT0G321_9ACTN|nr:FAD-dependent oxidoreductase [Actinomadura luzonensis]MCK2218989.1 FAD-dependent oxidoreductase [Actinomadura luzonensis]